MAGFILLQQAEPGQRPYKPGGQIEHGIFLRRAALGWQCKDG
jgi:hypothetical protein